MYNESRLREQIHMSEISIDRYYWSVTELSKVVMVSGIKLVEDISPLGANKVLIIGDFPHPPGGLSEIITLSRSSLSVYSHLSLSQSLFLSS